MVWEGPSRAQSCALGSAALNALVTPKPPFSRIIPVKSSFHDALLVNLDSARDPCRRESRITGPFFGISSKFHQISMS
jgi:hypothetical protein